MSRHPPAAEAGPDVAVVTTAPAVTSAPEADAVVARLRAAGAEVAVVRRVAVPATELVAVLHPDAVRDVPELAARYAGGPWVVGLRLGTEASLADLRHVVDVVDAVGADLHVTDGLLRGAIACRALLGPDVPAGRLVPRLLAHGLTEDEVDAFVLRDLLVDAGGDVRSLAARTRGLGLDDCVRAITHYVPPVFGSANGHGSGLRLAAFDRQARRLAAVRGSLRRFSPTGDPRPFRAQSIRHVTSLGGDEEKLGREAVAEGRVGLVAPAGGTGGRFAGHAGPEEDVRRNKALYRCFSVGDRDGLSGLDLRLANARWWRRAEARDGVAAPVPLAVMASDTNGRAIDAWRDEQRRAGVRAVSTFRQYGVYRLRRDALVAGAAPARWYDHVARRPDGRPTLKPPGNLGALTAFVLSGTYDAWREAGVAYLVLANGDDAGFRLDPRIVGHMRAADLDAVLLVIQTGYEADVSDGQNAVQLRWDQTGRGRDTLGRTITVEQGTLHGWTARYPGGDVPISAPRPDAGGLVCLIGGPGSHRVGVVERNWGAVTDPALETGCVFSSNQVYLRCDALDRLMGGGSAVARASALVDRLPMFTERSSVPMPPGEPVEVMQLLQPYAAVLRLLDAVELLQLNRHPLPDQRGTYAPLKHPGDERHAQHLLDVLTAHGDELLLST